MSTTFVRLASMVASVLLMGGIFASPAGATPPEDRNSSEGGSEHLGVKVQVLGDCEVKVTFANAVPESLKGSWAYWGDFRVGDEPGTPDSEFPPLPRDGEDNLLIDEYQNSHDHGVTADQLITDGPLAGQPFGNQHNPVLIHRGQVAGVTITLDGPAEVTAGIRRGPEQVWYVDWIKPVYVPCTPPASPSPAPQPSPSATPSVSPTPGEGDGDEDGQGGSEELAQTGASLPLIIGAGVALVVAGGVAFLAVRTRRTRFEA